MNFPADRRALVAVDLGAQSCRVSLLRWLPEGPHIQLVYRVANAPILRDGQLRWDLSALCATADEGLRRCAAIANEGIAAIGVTGWAVDYVRLDNAGHPIADPFCYRDARNAKAMEALHRRISPARLYKITGIQVLVINTLYQLYADNIDGISPDLRWLNLPEYMLYRWGARPIAEYTNATHSAMMELGTSQWSQQIFSAAGLDISAAPQIVAPGSVVGHLQGPLAQLPALRDTRLIAPACHDTASAVAGISAAGDDWAFLSSGTWSLLGTLSHHPCAGPDAAQWNFTNEGAVGGNFCFLRNINGMWLLQQCLESWNTSGHQLDIKTLMQAAETMPEPKHLLDVDDPDLLHPDNMPQRILECMERQHPHTSRDIDQSPAAIANLILHSLAARYASVLRQAEMITGKNFSRLYVVGGGSRNRLLNRLTQQATGLELICGSSESSTDGNFSVQLAALENVDRDVAGVSHANVAQWASLLSLNSMSSDAVFSSAASPQAAATMPTECLEEHRP